jgi:iron(III) transport system substrate-binding protein
MQEISLMRQDDSKVSTATLRRVAVVASMVVSVAAGARTAAAADSSLTLYNGQHEQSVNLLVADFTKRTGISVKVHSGDGAEIANQIAKEGKSSPADVYFTENSPELILLEEKGLLAPIDAKTLAEIPSQYNSPQGDWVGVVARENVLAYNPSQISADKLPKSMLELAGPDWLGKVGIAPSDSDFLPLVTAVAAAKGKDAAVAWLKGLEKNSQTFDDDEGVVAAVDRGAVATGIINSYYWARLQQEEGKAKTHAEIYHFASGDIGGLVNVSGAAALKTAPHPQAAQAFLAYLVSAPAQTLLAQSHIIFEYPLRAGVAADPVLKPFDQLQPPAVNVSKMGDDGQAADLLREAGLL